MKLSRPDDGFGGRVNVLLFDGVVDRSSRISIRRTFDEDVEFVGTLCRHLRPDLAALPEPDGLLELQPMLWLHLPERMHV